MAATTINASIPFDYRLTESTSLIPLGNNNSVIGYGAAIGVPEQDAIRMFPGKILDLVSDQKKVFCFLDPSFYHNIHDNLNFIVKAINEIPDAKIYINTSMVEEHNAINDSHVQYVLNALSERGVEYETVRFKDYSLLKVNNYYSLTTNYDIGNSANFIYDFVQQDIVNKRTKPFRRVYLSRRNQGNRVTSDPKVVTGGISDNRIDNHDIIENFFKSIGFEIIIPEIKFRDFKEQINFFYEVEMLVSVTSSGLTNSMFMQPGQTVVEIKTPLALQVNSSYLDSPGMEFDRNSDQMLIEEVHHFYEIISMKKNHLHISLPNIDKNMVKIIKMIAINKHLLSLISGNGIDDDEIDNF